MSPVPYYSRRGDPFSMDPLDHLQPPLDHLRPLSGQLDHLRPLSGPFDHLRPLSGLSDGFRPLCGLFMGVPLDEPPFVQVRMDWRETPTAHVFKADLPGLKKEEVKVEIEGDRMLQISGERSAEKEEMSDTWHTVERSSGKFVRRFRLPENAMVDQVKAAMENGVLTLTVPKEGAKKYDVRSIHITG